MCTTCGVTVSAEAARKDEFAGKLLGIMNSGALSIMISIGHRTGLFDAMSAMPPASSSEIATAAGLNERYVREWLGAMVTGGICEYDEQTQQYHLPAAHAALLCRSGGAENIATLAQYIPLLGAVEDKVVDCFKHGGGVPYSEFGRFQEVMADDSGQSVLPTLIEHILPLAPGLRSKLEQGIEVLDVGFGRGRALMLLAESFPRSRFTGYEISREGIEWARAEAGRRGLRNLQFSYQDAASIPDQERFDLIFTFDAVHDQADPAKVLRGIYQALKKDGVYLMQDIDTHTNVAENVGHPIGPLIYTISCMHCMTVSLAAGGAGLGAAWGVELAEQMLRDTGFTEIAINRLSHDIQNAYFVVRK